MTADEIGRALRCGRPGCACARNNGNVHCPAHTDDNPSLSVTERGGRVLVHCHAGCPQQAVIEALRARGLWQEPFTGLTLEELAEAKHLPVDFLQSLGLRTSYERDLPRVRIPYSDTQGEVVAVRFRSALQGAERFTWRRGDKPLLYGLWRLRETRQGGWALLVEGESDCWTAWPHHMPALGVPGKGTWRAEWARHLDGLDVYLWREPDAADLVERVARDLPDLRVIEPSDGLKDLSEAHLRGENIPMLIERLKALARPAADVLREQQDALRRREAEQALRESAGLLDDPRLLDRIDGVLSQLGLAGDKRNARLVYMGLTSRLLDRPVNIVVEGVSAAGKTHLVNCVAALFPSDAVYVLTASSERLLAYAEDDFRHRTIVVGEAAALHRDGIGATILRTLAWEGRLVYATVERTAEGLRPRRIEKTGPTGFITTTTRRLDAELATRILTVTVRDDPEQTRVVVREAARRAANGASEVDRDAFTAAQRWLASEGVREVVIPFANVLAQQVNVDAVRVRRDFTQLLTLIQTSALLHQRQRPLDSLHRVVATLDDYRIVYGLAADVFGAGIADGLTPAQREAVEVVRALCTANREGVTLRQVAEKLGIDKSAAHRRLERPLQRGYLVNGEDRRGYPARFRPGEDLPAPRAAIPDPEILTQAWVVYESGRPSENDRNAATPNTDSAPNAAAGSWVPPSQSEDHCSATAPAPATPPPAIAEDPDQSGTALNRCGVDATLEEAPTHKLPTGPAMDDFNGRVVVAEELFCGEVVQDILPLQSEVDRADASSTRTVHIGDPTEVRPTPNRADRQVVARRSRPRGIGNAHLPPWPTYRCACGWTGLEPKVIHTGLGNFCPRCGARVKQDDGEKSNDKTKPSAPEPISLLPEKRFVLWQAGVDLSWPRLSYKPGCSIAAGKLAWYTFARTAPEGDIDLALEAARKGAY